MSLEELGFASQCLYNVNMYTSCKGEENDDFYIFLSFSELSQSSNGGSTSSAWLFVEGGEMVQKCVEGVC